MNQYDLFQLYSLSLAGELRREFLCLQAPGPSSSETDKATLHDCHGMKDNQEWLYTKVKF
jgi:hypothetical protein